jgi:K+-sensing histidine kinase KdpD
MRRTVVRVLGGAAVPLAIVVAIIPARTHVENTNIALGLAVVVMFAAAIGGRLAAIPAALSAAVSFDFFLTQPFNSLRITRSNDIQTTVLLVLIGVIASELVERVRRSSAKAAATRSELETVYRRAELAAGAESPGQLITLAAQELTRLLDLKSCRYVAGPAPLTMPELRHNSIRVPAGVDPAAHALVALPVRAHGRLQGHLVLAFPFDTVGVTLTPDQRHAAVALADQVGVGLLRFHDTA